MTLSHWFDQSPNGKHFLLPGLDFLHNIYEKINSRTNQLSPELNLLESEAAKMRIFFHTKIRDICSALEFSLMVEYDAHVFLHKYFIKHGLLDHDTKYIMYELCLTCNKEAINIFIHFFRLACIYLASKTQNMHLTMDQFVSKIPILQKALDYLQTSFLIDEIILIETPSHIALACVLSSNETCET